MEKYITDERTGLKYELVGDYYLIAGEDKPEQEPIGIWGQRHGKFLREHKHAIYSGLLISGKLNSYLREIDRQAAVMFSRMVKQMAAKEDITEKDAYKNHIRYVAYPDSQIMYDNNLTLEEYLEEMKKYDYKNQYILTDTHGGKYCVYFVPADKSKTTNIPIPIKGDKELRYRISGNAKDGFIVSAMIEEPK